MGELIVGFGQIGKAVKEAVCFDDVWEIDEGLPTPEPGFDVMHICFPYSDLFVTLVDRYIADFRPKHVIVWSTVPIGTCRKITLETVHSPVEGVHPDLELSIRQMTRWVGYNDESEGKFFRQHFASRGLNTKLVPNTDFTEALKLLSTTEYGLNIEFARYKKQVADGLGMDFELTKDWSKDYNRLYKNLGLDNKYQKFVLDAPEGPKGGHCIVPNARLLNEQYPNDLVRKVAEL